MLKVKDLKGQYEATAIFKASDFMGIPFTLENRESIIRAMSEQLESQGATPIVEGNNLKVKESGQFWKLPTIPEKRVGVIKFNSKDYAFSCPEFKEGRASHGQKPKKDFLTSYGFYIETPQGVIEYHLKERESK